MSEFATFVKAQCYGANTASKVTYVNVDKIAFIEECPGNDEKFLITTDDIDVRQFTVDKKAIDKCTWLVDDSEDPEPEPEPNDDEVED